MDRRWPWKKKSSDKSDKAAAAAAAAADSLAATLPPAESQAIQDNYKRPNYVQISVESYSHLTGLEDKVKNYEEQFQKYEEQFQKYEERVQTYDEQVQSLEDHIRELNEELAQVQTDNTTKEKLVKQHSKVAEEAVSGWEKAEAEALALKNQLESVTLLKLTAEDKAAHLDGALKECMRQIRNLKEEHEQKLQDVVITKNKLCEKIKLELESRIAGLDQELLKVDAENAALSRSLQDRSNMVVKISEEKSRAEAEIEHLRSTIESCEREINSFKYEVHVVSKELEIRNEEKNMSVRSAEVANKQYAEGAKKIAKLEAECQRLRGLVRKKLPGPAALAQMKMEVESLGREYGDTRLRRSPVKPSSPLYPSSPQYSQVTDFSLDNSQKFQKENEFLTERLLAFEEETKMLKEALAKRNSELQASRNLCAKTVSKLQSLEAQVVSNQQKSSPNYSSQNASNPPSITSVSEDGNDDDASIAESWATAVTPEIAQLKKERSIEKSSKTENAKRLDLMDDFLEMEKLACLPNDSHSNGVSAKPACADDKSSDIVRTRSDASEDVSSSKDLLSVANHDSPILKLRSKISMVLESMSKDADMKRTLEDIKCVLQDAQDDLNQHSVDSLPQDSKVDSETMQRKNQELAAAVSQIHDFVLLLGKESNIDDNSPSSGNELNQMIEEFSVTFNKVLSSEGVLPDFVSDLSRVLAKASELKLNVLSCKGNGVEINSPDCIDKVALPENKVVQQDSSGEIYQNGYAHPEVPDDGNLLSHYEAKTTPGRVSLEEFEELKSERDNMAEDLAQCTGNLEMTKSKLHETEHLLAETKQQLASALRTNTLSETQLKCMAESYNSLETRAAQLESEVTLLREKIETVENELQDEKQSHQDSEARCKELAEQLQRNESCSVCSSAADSDQKTKERDLAAAAEKLAECQETIFLLGKQLKSLGPQAEATGSLYNGRTYAEEEPTTSSNNNNQDSDHLEMDTATSASVARTGGESPVTSYASPPSPSDKGSPTRSPGDSKALTHRPNKSGSSSTCSTPTPEKNQRGFSRFFSSKAKNG